MSKKLFISYSHDSDKHKIEISNLCMKLRELEIDAVIDLFVS